MARAQAGVQVYMLYDWFGCLATSRELWRRMARAGVKVRRFRPLYFTDPLQALQREPGQNMRIRTALVTARSAPAHVRLATSATLHRTVARPCPPIAPA